MGPETPCQFNQKRSLTICAKWNTFQDQGGANHAVDRCALAGESGSVNFPFRNETPSRCLVNVQAQLSDIFFKDGRLSNCRQMLHVSAILSSSCNPFGGI